MKILVAMSGGVDSTVAAYLLKKEGHEVIGVNFDFVGAKSCEPLSNVVATPSAISDELVEISKKLGIRVIYKDYTSEFHDKVITSFVNDYENGITPNPCALCNGVMKFEKLLEVMREENCDMVATGHYADISEIKSENNIRYCIKKSTNLKKDQSYMLYRLNQEQLSHIRFPLSYMDKSKVREIAKELGLSVADKKDSQDVCFIKSITYQEFIKRFEFGSNYRERIANGLLNSDEIESKKCFSKGEFIDKNGKVLGFHDGIINYTVGQRKGLNIAFGERKFVVNINADNNQVVLGNNDDLMSLAFKIYDVVFSGISKDEMLSSIVGTDKTFYAKLRYRHDGTLCKIVSANVATASNDLILNCELLSKVRAITRGQAAVFYDENDNIMFGGRIL